MGGESPGLIIVMSNDLTYCDLTYRGRPAPCGVGILPAPWGGSGTLPRQRAGRPLYIGSRASFGLCDSSEKPHTPAFLTPYQAI